MGPAPVGLGGSKSPPIRRQSLTKYLIAIAVLAAVPAFAQKGNGAPSGSHYNLNIIGVDKGKTPSMTDTSRHTIFVALRNTGDTGTRINLYEGEFAVLDGNGTDGTAAFQLPDPGYNCPADPNDPCWDDPQVYTVWIRALGKPFGSATITTCQEDKSTAEIICSTESVEVTRTKGRQRFDNVTKKLTTLCLDTDADLLCDTRVAIFSDDNQQYFWDYDNDGLRLAQLRFYPVP